MTGRGVTVVVVDDGVEHTIKDIQPNYVSAEGTERCLPQSLGQGGKCQWESFSWDAVPPSCRAPSCRATHSCLEVRAGPL